MLNKTETKYLKGLAILFIMLHNLLHLMNNAPGENEFTFSEASFVNVLEHILWQPTDFLKQFFSFFGHYGVQIFVFLSAYGLSQKYKDIELGYIAFIKQRFRKLYPVFVGVIVLYVISKLLLSLRYPFNGAELEMMLSAVLLRLSLLSNLIPGQALIITGPWWFFSMIFQFYLLFPLLFRLKNKQLIFVAIAAWLIQSATLFISPSHTEYLRVNFIGHLPAFCLGIFFAKNNIQRVPFTVFVAAIVLFFLGCFFKYLWVFSFVNVPIIALFLIQKKSNFNTLFARFFIFAGANSVYLFAVHGLLRQAILQFGWNDGWITILPITIFLVLSFAAALFLKYILQLQIPFFVRK